MRESREGEREKGKRGERQARFREERGRWAPAATDAEKKGGRRGNREGGRGRHLFLLLPVLTLASLSEFSVGRGRRRLETKSTTLTQVLLLFQRGKKDPLDSL